MQLLRGLAEGRQAISRALLPFCAQLRLPEDIPELWTVSPVLQTSGPEHRHELGGPTGSATDLGGPLAPHFQDCLAKPPGLFPECQVCVVSRDLLFNVYLCGQLIWERDLTRPNLVSANLLHPRPTAGCKMMLCCFCLKK